ncbi:hypothetical protein GGF37_002027 [Kickxella alabastrina]|nr:hypothetical protein GGF37_002027 [Kickxella alabastrina]
MATTLQTLPKQILEKIVYHYYDRQLPKFHPKFYKVYEDFRQLSQLCHSLRQVARPYTYRRVIFERYNLAVEGVEPNGLTHEALMAAKKLSPVTRWKSNHRLIEKLGLFEQVEEVVLSTYDRYPDPKDVLEMLRQRGFNRHMYPNATVLIVNFKSDYDLDDKAVAAASVKAAGAGAGASTAAAVAADVESCGEWIPDQAFSDLAQYLLAVLPSVDTLWMDDNRCSRVGPRSAMTPYISAHLEKLKRMHLRFSHMPAFGVKVLPPQITHLTISVHSAYDYVDIPRIVTPALQSLTLSAIPIHYLWDRFCQSPVGSAGSKTQQLETPGIIDFPELRELNLTFHVPYRTVPSGKSEEDLVWERYNKEGPEPKPPISYKGNPRLKTISIKERTPKYTVLRTDTRRPRFPKLRHLNLNMYPGRVHEFLRDIPTEQLLSLSISGDLVAYKALRLRGFASLVSVDISHFSVSRHRHSPHANRLLAHVLALASPSLRTMSSTMSSDYRLALPPPGRILCTHLRRLTLTAQISYADVPDLLRRLPLLEHFELQRALLVTPPAEALTPEGLARHFLMSDDKSPVSTSVIKFAPDVMCRNATDELVFYNIFMLISRIPSLCVLKMFSFYSTHFFDELLPMLNIPTLFPFIRHLIKLECGK